MTDSANETLERIARRIPVPKGGYERVLDRRDRKRRARRISAGIVGFAVFVAAIWIVRDVALLDRSQTSVIGGSGATGPAVTGPAVYPAVPPAVTVPATDYLFHLDTGQMTPLPESIAGTDDQIIDYAPSPDGSKVAYAGPGRNGTSQVFVANLDGSGVEQVTTDTEATAPAWSPDGSEIAYIGQRHNEPANVFVLDLVDGVSKQVTFESAGVFQMNNILSPPTFTPDGASIVYPAEGEIRIVQIAGGESALLTDLPGYPPDRIQLSPDGSLLAYSCGERLDDARICVADADGTHARELARTNDDLLDPRWSPDGTRLAYYEFHSLAVFVLDVATGTAEQVTYGAWPVWLDNHTMIVKADRCPGPGSTCGG